VTDSGTTDLVENLPSDQPVTVLPVGLWQQIAVRLVVATALGLAVGIAIVHNLPNTVVRKTDVVGYPAARGFDIHRMRNVYFLWTLLVPLVILAAYHLLPRVVPRLSPHRTLPTVRVQRDRSPPQPRVQRAYPGLIGRAGLVGCVLGLEASVVATRWHWAPSALVLGGGAGLAALAYGTVFVSERRGGSRDWLAHGLLVAASLASFAGLYLVSRSTWIVVRESHQRVAMAWLPGFPAGAFVVVVSVATLRSWQKFGASHAERRLVIFGVGSVAIFLLAAYLPGTIGAPDLFHNGEQLAGGALLRSGLFPWRDFLAIHGLALDSVFPSVSSYMFGDSYWAVIAGNALLFEPLCLVGFYLVAATLLERRWVLLSTFALSLTLGSSVAGGLLAITHRRMLLYPFLLVVMIGFLRKGTWTRGITFTALFFVLVIASPEAALLLFGLPPALIASELYGWKRGQPLVRRFRRTGIFAVTGALLTLLFVVVLARKGAVDDFVYTLTTFSVDHILTGAFPLLWGAFTFAVATYGVPLSIVLCLGHFVWRLRSRRSMRPEDWVMLGASLSLAPYYTKFLDRGDNHVFQPWSMAIPVLLYLVLRASELIEYAWSLVGPTASGTRVRSVIGFVVLVALMFPWLPPWRANWKQVTRLGAHYQADAAQDPPMPRAGYTVPSALWDQEIPDLDKIFSSITGRKLSVFDFTNQPGLYYYFLGLKSPTRYFHVSMAIRRRNQVDLIAELEAARPDVVVFDSANGGLPNWDGLWNQVRHYEVSEWILRRYDPWLQVHGQTLFARRGLDLPRDSAAFASLKGSVVTDVDVAESPPECTWFESGSRLDVGPTGAPRRLETQRAGAVATITGWAAADRRPARNIFAVASGQIVAAAKPTIPRPDAASVASIAPETLAGFTMSVPLITTGGVAPAMTLVAEYSDGSLSTLPAIAGAEGVSDLAAAAAPAFVGQVQQLGAGIVERVEWSMAADDGSILFTNGKRHVVERVGWPSDASSYHTFTIGALDGGALESDDFRLTRSLVTEAGSITLQSVKGNKSLTIPGASCGLWYGVRTQWLYLIHDRNIAGGIDFSLAKRG
jgi:hypothetical protein